MAVYTKINKKNILSIEKIFHLEKIVSFKGIKKGIENTNYFDFKTFLLVILVIYIRYIVI